MLKSTTEPKAQTDEYQRLFEITFDIQVVLI
jgi:hypothetical protein